MPWCAKVCLTTLLAWSVETLYKRVSSISSYNSYDRLTPSIGAKTFCKPWSSLKFPRLVQRPFISPPPLPKFLLQFLQFILPGWLVRRPFISPASALPQIFLTILTIYTCWLINTDIPPLQIPLTILTICTSWLWLVQKPFISPASPSPKFLLQFLQFIRSG